MLSDDQRFEAAPVRLDDETEAQGYGLVGTSTPELTRLIELADVEREVTLLNHVAKYEHRPGLAVGVVSTPAVREAGQSLNPIATTPLGILSRGRLARSSSSNSTLSRIGHAARNLLVVEQAPSWTGQLSSPRSLA